MKKLSLLMCSLFFLIFGAKAQDEDVMLQVFDWNIHQQPAGTTWYQVLSANVGNINNIGIDAVWMPPPSNSAAPQGYLPRELYDLNTAYGTEAQLRGLINQFHNQDIKVLSDVVINHRVGSADAVAFANPAWPTFYITADDEGRQFVNYPVEFSINGDYVPGTALKSDGSNGTYGPARDLDHYNPAVRQAIKDYLLFLKNDVGFDGWRYDFVHGYDPIFNKEYNDATNPYFAVGELLESSRVQTNNWVNFTQQSSSAFDFNTKVTLQNALRDNNLSYLRDFSGNASGMIGINPTKSVTFIDNHDTGESQQCCGPGYVFPGGEVNLRKGYAYILTHPGNPMVFWTHLFDRGQGVQDAIKDLTAIRKDVRVYAGSPLSIAEARQDLYAAYIDGRNGTIAMKLGSGNWAPNGSGWTLRTSGVDYAIWTQGGGTTPPPAPVDPFTVNFKKPSNWGSNVSVYLFDNASNTVLGGTVGWPGEGTNQISGTDWYSYNVNPPSGVAAGNISLIFNDGASNQTVDLTRSTDGWFTVTGSSSGQATGSWSATCPTDCSSTPPPPPTSITVNIQKPSSWGNNVKVYLYDLQNPGTLGGTAAWPGNDMTQISGTNWYAFTANNVPSGDVGVVFNDGNGNQTVDLTRGSDGWFTVTGSSNGKATGSWSATCPANCSGTTPPPSNQVTLNFKTPSSGWGSNTNVYLFNQSANGTLSGTAGWPGASMASISGTSWKTLTFTLPAGVSSGDVGVVFNDGSGGQTVDLSRGTDGWFTVTGTSNGKRTGAWSASCTSDCPSGARVATSGAIDNVKNIANEAFITVYPNPFADYVKIGGLPNEQVSISVYDVRGQRIFFEEGVVNDGNRRVDLPQAKGLYIIEIITPTQRIKKKIMSLR